MAWRSAGSLSRSLLSTPRVSSLRSAPSLPRLRPPPSSAPRRRYSFADPRNLGQLGCAQSLLSGHAAPCLTSHMTVNIRACCELSHGRNGKDG